LQLRLHLPRYRYRWRTCGKPGKDGFGGCPHDRAPSARRIYPRNTGPRNFADADGELEGIEALGHPGGQLTAGHRYFGQGKSIWSRYRWHIFSIFSLCILEGGLIVALLVHRARRRGAEKAMRESKRVLQSTIDALNARVALLDEEGTIIAVNQ